MQEPTISTDSSAALRTMKLATPKSLQEKTADRKDQSRSASRKTRDDDPSNHLMTRIFAADTI